VSDEHLHEPGERTPPADEAAERSVVGSIMMSQRANEDVTEAMRPEDFYQPRHETILRAALALTRRGAPVDVITVGDELTRAGLVAQAGGIPYLHECVAAVTTPANAGFYARIVAEKATLRRLVEAGTRITQMGFASEGDAAALVESARAEVDGVTPRTVQVSAPIGSLLDEMVDALGEKPQLTPTPWEALDGILGGIAPGRLYVIAGRPGKGKSVIATQLAFALAQHGPVGYVSLEMSRMEVLQRLASCIGSIPLTALVKSQLTDTDWNSMARVVRPALADLPLEVRDDIRSLEGVLSFARSLHRRGGMQGLVVDYLQIMDAPAGRSQDRRHEIDAITRACKELAMALGIPVFLLSQLNRQGVARGKGKEAPPVLSDLKESGAIEQDADIVLLLHREEPKGSVLEVNVAKHRQGPQGLIELLWEGQFARAVTKVWAPTAMFAAPADEEARWPDGR